MKSNLSSVFAFSLLIGDFFAILGAFAVAYVLRVTFSDLPFISIPASEYARSFVFLSPLWIVIFALFGLYSRNIYEWRLKELGRLFVGSAVGFMAIITYQFAVNRPLFPARIVPVYAFFVGYLLLVLFRTILRAFRLLARHRGFGIVNTVLIGDGAITLEFLERLKNPKRSGYRVVGVISKLSTPDWFTGVHTTSLEKGLSMLQELQAHTILLTKLYTDSTQNDRILEAAQKVHCGFRFIPTQESMYQSKTEVELFQGTPIVLVHQTPLIGANRIFKRLFDVAISSVVLLILSPLLLVTYLVLLLSGGNPIYTRDRLTRYGNSFKIYKFRSHKRAYSGLDPEAAFAKMGRPELAIEFRKNGDQLANDPRVSRFGRFIRTYSIDELPQLFNVLRGDISLVGPRALIAEELRDVPGRELILSAKSGLTGLAVISGRKDIPFDERRRLDIYYIQNWSFWMDMKILLRTAVEVLSRRGAA